MDRGSAKGPSTLFFLGLTGIDSPVGDVIRALTSFRNVMLSGQLVDAPSVAVCESASPLCKRCGGPDICKRFRRAVGHPKDWDYWLSKRSLISVYAV